MGTFLTEQDLRSKYVEAMGRDLGSLCHDLRKEVDWLQDKWSMFRELFSEGSERLDLLNTVASNFFYSLHKLLFEDAMLHLCRLSDPAETRIRVGKKVTVRKNLTVMGLADAISDPVLKGRVGTEAKHARHDCEFARALRNQRLAHTDLETFRNGIGLLVLSKHIEDAIKSISAPLNSIEEHYGRPPSLSIADPWGAKALVQYLGKAALVVQDGN
jgi:hypothetical protein